jgi:tetraprenyl-beta-curcumene synthase
MTCPDPAPLSVRQLRALGISAGRELRWGLSAVKTELATWSARAHAIPDQTVRADVLQGMSEGRALVDGAALFWTLPSGRRPELLRILVAFQTLLNFVDIALERDARGPDGRPRNWTWLARDALDVDAVLPAQRTIVDAVGDDGGYLHALMTTCRQGCATLAKYREARPLLLRETDRARAFEIEHDRDRLRRADQMRSFAAQEFGAVTEIRWWELAAGASSMLTAMAVLGLAAEEDTTSEDLHRAADAYVWVASAAALLDSYVDQFDDAATDAHNWFDYYPTRDAAVHRAAALIHRALDETSALRYGERHLVIVTSMTALALSSDSARNPRLHESSRLIARHGGCLTRLLIPVLRAWRIAYGERDS